MIPKWLLGVLAASIFQAAFLIAYPNPELWRWLLVTVAAILYVNVSGWLKYRYNRQQGRIVAGEGGKRG